MIVHLSVFYLIKIQHITNKHTEQSSVFLRGLSNGLNCNILEIRILQRGMMSNPM